MDNDVIELLPVARLQHLHATAMQAAQTVPASTPLGFSLAVFLLRSRPEVQAYQAAVGELVEQHGAKGEDGQPLFDAATGQPVWADRAKAEAAMVKLNSHEISQRISPVPWERAIEDAPQLTAAMALDLAPLIAPPA